MEKIRSEIIDQIDERINKLKTLYNLSEKHTPYYNLNDDIGILIVHGFGDTCYKMKDFADFLISNNYSVYNLTIPPLSLIEKEHGNKEWQVWIDQIKEDYLLFKKLVKKIILAGFSTGATIVLYLSQILDDNEKPDGFILLAPAIFIVKPFIPLTIQIFLMKIFSIFEPYPHHLNNKHLIYMDQVQRKRFENKERSNAKTIIELMKFIKTARRKIKDIKHPILMIQTENDIVISPYGAKWLYKKLNQKCVKFIKLYKSGHPIIVDIEKEKVFQESLNFINSLN
ncbi:MAG: alpha/beta hydrolase [Spirochaetes bacterium]|nr:alpha/beta hydrolase [Spirochaetota bacterium]